MRSLALKRILLLREISHTIYPVRLFFWQFNTGFTFRLLQACSSAKWLSVFVPPPEQKISELFLFWLRHIINNLICFMSTQVLFLHHRQCKARSYHLHVSVRKFQTYRSCLYVRL